VRHAELVSASVKTESKSRWFRDMTVNSQLKIASPDNYRDSQ